MQPCRTSYRERYVRALSSRGDSMLNLNGRTLNRIDLGAQADVTRDKASSLAPDGSTSENRDRGTLESRGISQRPLYREQVLASPSSSSLSLLLLHISLLSLSLFHHMVAKARVSNRHAFSSRTHARIRMSRKQF